MLALAGCGRSSGEESKSDDHSPDQVTVEVVTAQVRPMDTVISAQGTLTAAQGANAHVAAVVAGRLAAVRVQEGERVDAGQVIALVDDRSLQAQAHSAAAALTASEAQARQGDIAARAAATDQTNSVHLALLTLDAARLDRDNAVTQTQTVLDAAQTDLHKTQAGARPQEIAQADQTVNQDKATRDRAATELTRVQFLYEKGIDAKRELDDAQTALAVAESSLASAQQQADLVRAGARPEDLRAAQLRVQQAREALDQAKTSGAAKVAQAQAALQQARQDALQVAAKQQESLALRETANQKRADLAAAQATAGYAELRAPLTGIVTRRALNPGDMADPTTPVVEITDIRALNLIANLTAEDGMLVRRGMRVRVTTPDVPDRTFAGRVLSVGQVDPQTNLLTVRIAASNSEGRLKVGSFAQADIILRTDLHAVVVPKPAVVSHEGKSVVFVDGADNVAHQHEVTVGAERGGLVEILHGVVSGDRVITLGQYELSDGGKVQLAAKGEDDKPEGTPASDKTEGTKDSAP
jgi:RND family efflux transporter MFP subunit